MYKSMKFSKVVATGYWSNEVVSLCMFYGKHINDFEAKCSYDELQCRDCPLYRIVNTIEEASEMSDSEKQEMIAYNLVKIKSMKARKDEE